MKRTPLRRYTPLRQVSAKRAAQTPAGGSSTPVLARPRVRRYRFPVDVAALVYERSGPLCEAALEGCWTWAKEKHHRVSQKAGGRHGAARRRSDRASNILHLCVFCHHVVTLDPEESYESGLSLRERQEPTAVPVLYRGDWVYLDDAGGVHDYETAGD